ncbi:MAG: aldehyde ferredoxin oxidoreductase family protein [Chloroflexi bacterium]|nr:aldehyde ferredoxin oxidoreductase family protein [Chloroflexota bacterium]
MSGGERFGAATEQEQGMPPTAYTGKTLEIDLTTGTHTTRELSEEVLAKFVGGTGLGAYLLWEMGAYRADSLGPDNVLIFGTGPFTGTQIPLSNRFGVCARSPLTGAFGEAECGGHWASDLKRSGYDQLVITGRAEKPVYLWVHDDEVEIRDATHLWGKDTFETFDLVQDELGGGDRRGEAPGVVCIGPAGERLVRFAAIMNDGKDGRAAGRTGMGAVMGSKNLKAIACKGTKSFPLADEAGLKANLASLRKTIVATSKGFGALGTAGGVPVHDKMGNWPIKNWQVDHRPDIAENLSGAKMKESILTGRYFCGSCIIGCGRTVEVREGPYAGIEQGGLEYETTALNGANLLVDDITAVQKANELCNRLGMDTISAGGVIGFAMEAYERGLIDRSFTDGIDLVWGSSEALVETTRRMGLREGEFGRKLSEGTVRLADMIGGHEFAIHARGLDYPAHDPRAFYANAVAYATSARGACHLSSFGHVFQRVISLPEFGYPEPVDRQNVEESPRVAMLGQNIMGWFDSAKCCKFLFFGGVKPTNIVEWYALTTGRRIDMDEFLEIGERIYTIKRLFNIAAGSGQEADTMPARMSELPRDIGTDERSVPPFEPMLKRFYELRGWTEDGYPRPATLERLGLPGLERVGA